MIDPKGKTNKEKYDEYFAEWVISKGKKEEMEKAGKTSLKSYATLCLKIGNLKLNIEALDKVKDIVELSESAKTHLIDVYVATKYNRHDDIETAAMKKGTAVEKDSMTIYSAFCRDYFVKNTEHLSNEFIKGTPDIRVKKNKEIIELKSCWDAFTFFRNLGEDVKKMYYWQCQGYMWLDDADKARLVYCLVNTPEFLIDAEAARMKYKVPPSELEEAIELLKKQLVFNDIPYRERIIEQHILRNDDDIKKGEQRVIQAREYLQKLDTEAAWRSLNTELK